MREIAKDMACENIEVILSEDIRRDAMVKFSYVSPIGVAGLYCNATAADFQKDGEAREMFKALITEIVALSHAMGIEFSGGSCGAKSEDCGTTGTGGNHLYAERCVCGQKIRNRWSCI